ncbi:bacterial proteasome activator family protein [soil metagenome]
MQENRPQDGPVGDDNVVVVRTGGPVPDAEEGGGEAVQHPAKVMRIASMARQLLEEVRQAQLDQASRSRMREIYDTSLRELADVLSPDLQGELERLSSPFNEEVPSEAELRVAHAQLVGWLEGLFHGIQAMLFAQQMESRQRLEEMRRRSLPPGSGEIEGGSPGTYL